MPEDRDRIVDDPALREKIFSDMLVGKWPYYAMSATPTAPGVDVADIRFPGESRIRHALFWFLYASRSPLKWSATGMLAVLVIAGGMAMLLVAGAGHGRYVSYEHGLIAGAVVLLVYGLMEVSEGRPGIQGRPPVLQQWLRPRLFRE